MKHGWNHLARRALSCLIALTCLCALLPAWAEEAPLSAEETIVGTWYLSVLDMPGMRVHTEPDFVVSLIMEEDGAARYEAPNREALVGTWRLDHEWEMVIHMTWNNYDPMDFVLRTELSVPYLETYDGNMMLYFTQALPGEDTLDDNVLGVWECVGLYDMSTDAIWATEQMGHRYIFERTGVIRSVSGATDGEAEEPETGFWDGSATFLTARFGNDESESVQFMLFEPYLFIQTDPEDDKMLLYMRPEEESEAKN